MRFGVPKSTRSKRKDARETKYKRTLGQSTYGLLTDSETESSDDYGLYEDTDSDRSEDSFCYASESEVPRGVRLVVSLFRRGGT